MSRIDPSKSKQSYRDRAKERRDGINNDFELDPDDIQMFNPIQTEDAEFEDEDELRRRLIEESKYLGGDKEHTHLVKGLDFALLEKIKVDQKFSNKKIEVPKQQIYDINAINNPDEDNDDEDEELETQKSSKFVTCRTALARRILNLHEERWPEKSELFLPGRMTYVMHLDQDQPVTAIIRSKAEK